MSAQNPVHYIPILTTVLAAVFGTTILRRFLARPSNVYLAWWSAGVYIYGIGTLCESLVTLFGWHEPLFRLWYVTGALLGGLPLAQGSVYFHLGRRTADRLSSIVVPLVVAATIAVAVVPLDPAKVETYRLSGRVMTWTWVHFLSPPINLYAVVFLIGGAILSAVRHAREHSPSNFVWGNALIALGAILPGIGGAATRAGHVEVLYVLECVGLLFIWRGYALCVMR